MKRTILLGLLWLSVAACEKKEDAAPQAAAKVTVVSYQKSSDLKISGDDLKINLLAIADSRCPINAVCITAGNADLKFNISNGTSQMDVHLIFTGGSKSVDSQEFKLGGQTYNLIVTEVLPFPDTSKSPKLEDYKIGVTIEKK